MRRLAGLLLVSICFFGLSALAQTNPSVVTIDSTLRNPDAKKNPIFKPKKDTTIAVNGKPDTKQTVFKDSARLALEKLPRQAVRRSAILPGWGQVGNGNWWKVPIIYAGFAGIGYYINFNQKEYKQVLTELQYRYKNKGQKSDPELITGDDRALIDYKDYWRRNRDLLVLSAIGLYAVNMIDAYVVAKFFRFDVSDELGIKIKPSVIPSISHAFSPVPAIKIQLKL